MHLLITGKPSCGKTTLIKTLLAELSSKRGFFTEEIRNVSRLGFKIITLEGKEAIFAHIDFKSNLRVSKYGIDLEIFNKIAINEIREAILSNCEFIVIDELGKMELFSEEFKKIVTEALEKKRILGTISLIEDPFLEEIRNRKDVCILNLEKNNFFEILDEAKLILKSLPVEKIKVLEEKAKKIGLYERLLIENASFNLFKIIQKLDLGKKVFVVAGKGNNGADVLSCARRLISNGYEVKVAILYEKELNEEVVFQKEVLEKLGIKIYYIQEDNLNLFRSILEECDFILDGILGIGIKKEVSGLIKEIIDLLNESNKKIIACDIPSGLSPNTGEILGTAIKAFATVTFIATKQGFFLNKGKALCGKIFLVDIGISKDLLENVKL